MNLRVLIAIVIATNVGSAIGVVLAIQQHRQLFAESSRLERVRDELNIEFGRLQLEQATWAESARIDQIARQRIGMRAPNAGEIRVVRP